MSDAFPEPTRLLQEWYRRWFTSNFSKFKDYYTLEEIGRIGSLGEGMAVTVLFDLIVADKQMFDKLDYGTSTTPTFNLQTLVDNFLMGIYPEYEDDVAVALFATVM